MVVAAMVRVEEMKEAEDISTVGTTCGRRETKSRTGSNAIGRAGW
jgi:hypothetical protein